MTSNKKSILKISKLALYFFFFQSYPQEQKKSYQRPEAVLCVKLRGFNWHNINYGPYSHPSAFFQWVLNKSLQLVLECYFGDVLVLQFQIERKPSLSVYWSNGIVLSSPPWNNQSKDFCLNHHLIRMSHNADTRMSESVWIFLS